MLFNSYEFIFFFLPFTFFIYYFLLEKRLITGAKGFLVFSSLLFYSWWNVVYLPIILSSLLFNYILGISLNEKYNKSKFSKNKILTFGIIINIALLGYFKYSDFFIENFNITFDGSIPLLDLSLPLAISFFTFQQIAYLVDSYRQETAEYNFLDYSLFVTFFPQLIAGPIVHHKEMMPQFVSRWSLVKNYKNIALGLFIFSIGLFKKVVIADTFAKWATAGFDNAITLNLFEAWVTSLSYTFQLYFDFSGYTDMAIGVALLFNIRLPINFNSPYKALDIQDFWRRWHITLSRFLRDYVYIPLGGNRSNKYRTYGNLMATFIIGGIWHGAGWTFIFWGILHGIALIIHRFWKELGFTMPKIIAWIITFNFINISWVFFRAKEWEDAIKVFEGMFGMTDMILPNIILDNFSFLGEYNFINGSILSNIPMSVLEIIWIILAFKIVLFTPNSTSYIKNLKFSYKSVFISGMLFVVSVLLMHEVSEFLYFNF